MTYIITKRSAQDLADRLTTDAGYRPEGGDEQRELVHVRDGIVRLFQPLVNLEDTVELPSGDLEDMALHYDADVTEIA